MADLLEPHFTLKSKLITADNDQCYTDFITKSSSIVEDKLKEHPLLYVVIASCTGKEGEITFNYVEYTHGGPVSNVTDFELIVEAVGDDYGRSCPEASYLGLLIFPLQ